MPDSASSALVNVADDAELRLVRLLAETAANTAVPVRPNFVPECEACIVQGDAAQLMRTILSEKSAVVALVSSLDEEAISVVSLLGALLDKVKNAQVSHQLVDELADAIVNATPTTTGDTTTTTSDNDVAVVTKSISLLATLYNMRSDSLEKVGLLVKMIQMASSRQPSLLDSTSSSVLGKLIDPSRLPAMLEDWKVNVTARRTLYLAAAEGSKTPLAKQRFLLLAVETYTSSDIDAEGLLSSQRAAIGAIQDPISLFAEQRNILSLPAIQALQNHSAPLLGLLKVFQEGKLEDYHSFIQSSGGESILGQWEVSPEKCTRHMRILSLCSLASEHEEIPYNVVAETLQVDTAEVEKWVIAAVSSGLLSAKMDQLQDKVIVERCVVRKFGMNQWKALQSRLHLWKQNVGGILDAYKQSLQEQQ